MNHRERRHGRSKYGIGRTIRVILDLMTVKFLLSYSTRPVQIFGLIGFAMGLPGVAILAWLAYREVRRVRNRLAIVRCCSLGILLVFTGVQLVTLGLLAEMQARTYHESQKKPTYVIRDVLEDPQPGWSGALNESEDLRIIHLVSIRTPRNRSSSLSGSTSTGRNPSAVRHLQRRCTASTVGRQLQQSPFAGLQRNALSPRSTFERQLIVDGSAVDR